MSPLIAKTNAEWRKILTPEQYDVLREKGTEPAFLGKYVHHKEDGTYACAACGASLFSSHTKFDSGSGWPSFWDVVHKGHVELCEDTSHGMMRTEVACASCGSHVGHVFPDGPRKKTGLRYCINSAALSFQPK